MKTLKLSHPIIDLDGNVIQPKDQTGKNIGEPLTLGSVLAGSLVSGSKGDALKFFDWALSLKKTGEIQVDDSDFNTLKEFVTNNDGISILAKAQILRAMTNESQA